MLFVRIALQIAGKPVFVRFSDISVSVKWINKNSENNMQKSVCYEIYQMTNDIFSFDVFTAFISASLKTFGFPYVPLEDFLKCHIAQDTCPSHNVTFHLYTR